MTVYEVFRQERKGQAFQHAGSIGAPNHEFAEIYAREQYGRRQESTALWLVPREAIDELGTTADELAFDRAPEEYRCSRLVELRLVPDWARTIARHYLYEMADAKRLEELKASDDAEVAGLAEKIDREEAYHRMHAEMWFERLKDEPRFREALDELRPLVDKRGEHGPEFAELWEEMTMVRRSVAGATW